VPLRPLNKTPLLIAIITGQNMSHSHRDYEPFELAENMEEDLGLFEAAVRSKPEKLHFGSVGRVMVLRDNSRLLSTVQGFASAIAQRIHSTVVEAESVGILTALRSRVPHFESAEGQVVDQGQEILQGLGVIVAPLPLGKNVEIYESSGLGESKSVEEATSLGDVAEELLQKSPVPVLFITEPMTSGAVENAMDTVMLAISRADAQAVETVSWAFRLTANQIILLEWVDSQALDEAQKLLKGRQEDRAVEQAVVGRAVTSQLGSLVGTAQKHAKDFGVAFHVEIRFGNPRAEVLDAAKAYACGMLVLSRPSDHTSPGFHLVRDLLLVTELPVLVI